jgi:hypothetical protein
MGDFQNGAVAGKEIVSATGQESAYNVAQTLSLLERKTEATDSRPNSYENHETDMLKLRIDPLVSSLKDKRQFREIVAQIVLPPVN